MAEKILCIQLKQIGDVLMITPSIRALWQSDPHAEIHVLTQVPSNEIFRHNQRISKTHLYPSSEKAAEIFNLIRHLRREKYSIVIDFYGQSKTALLSRLTGAPKRIGLKTPGRSVFYTHPVSTQVMGSYSAFQRSRLLTALGIELTDPVLEFPIGPDDEAVAEKILKTLGRERQRPLISISPVSRKDYKVWPANHFAEVADFLIEQFNAQVLFLWGPGEHDFVQAVRNSMRCQALPDYDIPSISETVALLKRVDLHIGNDNGPMHFAIATGVKTVAIFGRPLLRNWIPPNQDTHLAVEFDPGCKENCHYPKCELECIRGVSVESVLEKVRKQISG